MAGHGLADEVRETPVRTPGEKHISRYVSRLFGVALAVLSASQLSWAGDPRDIVFECPCSAEWMPGDDPDAGDLELTFGVRSHRSTASGELQATVRSEDRGKLGPTIDVGSIPGLDVWRPSSRTRGVSRPGWLAEQVVLVDLVEGAVFGSDGVLRPHESLALWRVPGDDLSERVRFVDILTDADGDGVGDVNERLASTDPDDAGSTPGDTEIDVLVLFDDRGADYHVRSGGRLFREHLAFHRDPYAQLHHLMAVTRALFADSGTRIRLRTVGMSEVEVDEWGSPGSDDVTELMEAHGADLSFLFNVGVPFYCGPGVAGCAGVGSYRSRGLWRYTDAAGWVFYGAQNVAHELGHVMGLAHSASQGETYGAFRWSRGHYVDGPGRERYVYGSRADYGDGTIMTYRLSGPGVDVFSSPRADCGWGPCGVPRHGLVGADAVASLDLTRFQVAAHRQGKRDTDGDRFVDAVDAMPDDASEWIDTDGDGVGDNADRDDDDDGVDDAQDPWPRDPTEWEDADGDHVGDNADPDVADLAPFRDAALRTVVENALGKSTGDEITAEDMATLVELSGLGRDIRNLTGLELAVGLEVLDLRFNKISDLSPLSGLEKLRELKLLGNAISDVAPLSELAGLRILDLYSNDIEDISPLSTLTGLRVLNLGRNHVAEIAALRGMANLEELHASGNRISDLAPLSGLDRLWQLTLASNEIADVSPLAGMGSVVWLQLDGNCIRDLSPLEGNGNLQLLTLSNNLVEDVTPLSGMAILGTLRLDHNAISEIDPLSRLLRLTSLDLGYNAISDLTPLSELADLRYLRLGYNAVRDVAPLSGLEDLEQLVLDGNRIDDVSPLRGLTRLVELRVEFNELSDVTPLAGLKELDTLFLGGNEVAAEDVAELAGAAGLDELGLGYLGMSDLSALASLTGMRSLWLNGNGISDIRPLVARSIWSEGGGSLRLYGNPLNGATIRDHIPSLESWGVYVYYHPRSPEVPIADASLKTLVAQQVAGGDVHVDAVLTEESLARLGLLRATNAGISDLAGLEAAVNLRIADLASNAITSLEPLAGLRFLRALDLTDNRVSDLSPLAGATNLRQLHLAGNAVTDLSPLAHLSQLETLVLTGNGVSDLAPLAGLSRLEALDVGGNRVADVASLAHLPRLEVLHAPDNWISDLTPVGEMPALRELDVGGNIVTDIGALQMMAYPLLVRLGRNPLNEQSLNRHATWLRRVHGTRLEVDTVDVTLIAGEEPTRFSLLAFFTGWIGYVSRFDAETDDPDIVAVEADDGVVMLTPTTTRGTATITVSATNDRGRTETLILDATVAEGLDVPVFPSASDTARQGFVRVINHSRRPGAVRMDAVDDSGTQGAPVVLAMPPGAASHFNSGDLEHGNRAKGLTGSTGSGKGDWRLSVASGLDIEALSYVRTADGFLAAMHDLAPGAGGEYRVAMFNPGRNMDQTSKLRVVNPAREDAVVTIRGIDGKGRSPGGGAELTVPGRGSRTLTALDLERGDGVAGMIGEGQGKWSLEISANRPVRVASLLESPSGHLTNLSTIPGDDEGVFAVPLFPSAADSRGRQGFVRVVNRGDAAASVDIAAFDETDRAYESLSLTVGPNEAAHFNSEDLEFGNTDKRLSGSTGAGTGHWRLELSSDADIEVLSYVRTTDGFLTSMHDVVPRIRNRHRVPTFNPGSNTAQISRLRLINPDDAPASVLITGIDGAGESSPAVRVFVAARTVESFTAAELESGTGGVEGALGTGTGKWQLVVGSDQPITVMSLLESPTSHLANLSTVPTVRSPPANAVTIRDDEIYKDGEFANFGSPVDPALPAAWVVAGSDARLDGVRIYADGSVRADIDPDGVLVDSSVRYAFTFEWANEVLNVAHTGAIADVRFDPSNARAVAAFYDLLVNDTLGSVTLSDDADIDPTPDP